MQSAPSEVGHDISLHDNDSAVTQTDLRGYITYVNEDFLRISGFSREELLGKNHNIVRHAEMPAMVFADLWKTLESRHPWNGLIKNRHKNGGSVWANAHIASIEENGQITGYTSVLTKPSPEQIHLATTMYARLNSGNRQVKLRSGKAATVSRLAMFNPLAALERMSARAQLVSLIGAFLLGFAAFGALNQFVLQQVEVGGPIYKQIDLQKELIADILPPPEYLVESWQVALEMSVAPASELPTLAEKSKALRKEYETRRAYWAAQLDTGELKSRIVDQAWQHGIAFLDLRDREYIPALQAGNRDAALALLPPMKTHYLQHRQQIDEVVKLAGEASRQTEATTKEIIVKGTVLLIAMCVLIALVIGLMGRSVYRNLTRAGDPLYVGEVIRHIAVGNFAFPIHAEKESSESVLHTVRALQSRLRELLGFVAKEAALVTTQSRQMVQAAAEVDTAVRQQSASVSSVAATTEQLTTSIQLVSENAQEALSISDSSSRDCEQGVQVIENAVHSMEQIAVTVRQASETVLSLGAQSEHISNVVQVIQDIADQTNLLALNAAIEAARAGEQGRGFAVVADEVRKLAERTSSATKEIENMIGAIQHGLHTAVSNMEYGVEQVDRGVTLAEDAGEAITRIREGARQVAHVVAQISGALAEQRIASESIAQQIEKIAQSSEQNSAAAQQTAAGAAMLEEASLQMQNSVGRFVV